MSTCPYCGSQNIEGADVCEACQYSLTHLKRYRPSSAVEERILKDRLHVLLPRTPLIVQPQASVGEVLTLMVQHRVGCVIVAQDDHTVLGIFSERDALMRLNTRFADLADRPISEFMTQKVETLRMDSKIAFALHQMDLGGYRHIPIIDDGRIAGVISVRDILRYIMENVLEAEPV